MKLRTFLAATAVGAAATAAPVALAQTAPINDGTSLVATVPSSLELIITQPKASLTKFSKAKTYSTSFQVSVITTGESAELSLVDGEVASGSKMGRLAAGKKLLPLPLEARVGKKAFSALNSPVSSMLTSWNEPVSRAKATVNLRQKVKAKASGNYRKVLLATLSEATP